MNLTDGEKLILTMLTDIQGHLGVINKHLKIKDDDRYTNNIDPEFVSDAIYSGHAWAIKRQYEGMLDMTETPPEVIKEVTDILNMWTSIELAYTNLSPAERAKIDAEITPK